MRLQVFVPGLAEITIEEAGAADPFSVPIPSIAAVGAAAEPHRLGTACAEG